MWLLLLLCFGTGLSDEVVAYTIEEEQRRLSPYTLLGETVMGKTLVQGKERGAWS